MANIKISELSSLTGDNLQDVDLLTIVDSDGNNDGSTTDKVTKSITVGDLKTGIFASTTFTGTPTAPTATAGTNTTQIATTEFVTGLSSALGGGSPTFAALADTAITSIGDEEIISYDNASSKYVNKTLAEAGIAISASPTFTGNPQSNAAPTSGDHLTNKTYVDNISVLKQVRYHQTQARTFETNATQILDTTKTDGTDPIPQSNQGVEVGTVTITPVNANSILKITAIVNLDVDGDHKVVALFKDDGADAIACSHNDLVANTDSEITLQYIEVAGSTTTRTYKYRAGGDGADVSINGDNDDKRRYGGTQVSSMVIEEMLNPS
jgi:hypothetical protein